MNSVGQTVEITGGAIYRRRIEESCASPQGSHLHAALAFLWQSSTMVQCEDGVLFFRGYFPCLLWQVLFRG